MSPRRLHSTGRFSPARARSRGGVEAVAPTVSYRQRRLGARHMPCYHGASKSSGLLSPRPSHDLLRQELLHCTCTAELTAGDIRGSMVHQAMPDRHTVYFVAKCHADAWDGG